MSFSIKRLLTTSLNPAYRLFKLKRRLRRMAQDRQYRALDAQTRGLEKIFQDEKLVRLFAGTSPRLFPGYYHDYISRQWTVADSIERIHAHYQFVLQHMPERLIDALAPGSLSLWKAEYPDVTGEVRLAPFSGQIYNEGELDLCLYANGEHCHTLGFSFLPLPAGGHCILIARSQGVKGAHVRIKQLQKAHGQIAPLYLLMDSLIALANTLGIKAIQVVAPQESYQERLGMSRLIDTYVHAFEPFDPVPGADGRLLIHLPLENKPLESIDRRHRKRTLTKRLAREALRTQVERCLNGTPEDATEETPAAPVLLARAA